MVRPSLNLLKVFVHSQKVRLNQVMKTISTAVIALVLAETLFGCATPLNSATGPGFLYTDHYEGMAVTANQAGRKRGEACTTNILGLITSGDASMSAAMKNGAVTVVSSVDRSYKSILGIYGKMCTIITGN
jgi:hypothetical protein